MKLGHYPIVVLLNGQHVGRGGDVVTWEPRHPPLAVPFPPALLRQLHDDREGGGSLLFIEAVLGILGGRLVPGF